MSVSTRHPCLLSHNFKTGLIKKLSKQSERVITVRIHRPFELTVDSDAYEKHKVTSISIGNCKRRTEGFEILLFI
uniref:Uncharacterized protein n=1 Tax=Heterorhabditis bacteriophora TaxID=37862 RepID=A0A1I7WSZ4_HETBA